MRNVTVIPNNSPLRCRFREIICLEPQIALVTFSRASKGREFKNVRRTLLFATVADHLQVRGSHVTVLGGVLVHAVLFCLGLRVFLHAVHFGIGDHAGNRDFMADMIAELEAVALDLPS